MGPGNFYIGKRLSYDGSLCTVRYVGPIDGVDGTWLGVEWDDPSRGKHSGERNGVSVFQCLNPYQRDPARGASFVKPARKLDDAVPFVEAVKRKYASEASILSPGISHSATNENMAPSSAGSTSIHISGKEVEEVGFDRVRSQLANLEALRIVLVDTLCVHRPDARRLLLEDDLTLASDVKETCPYIAELDLSRNLFEEFVEVVDIVRQLPGIYRLRIDGNRFSGFQLPLKMEEMPHLPPFIGLKELSLDDTLIDWNTVTQIVWPLKSLKKLSASGNGYETLPETQVPLISSLTAISLNRNLFTSLSDVCSLCRLPHLEDLELRSNSISTITNEGSTDPQSLQSLLPDTFRSNMEELDLSENSIASWSFISALNHPRNFENLKYLRISRNPIYDTSRSADGRRLGPEDGFILTSARLANVERLNYSLITDRDRLNAETWYLSQIHGQLRLSRPSEYRAILSQHPRYEELCQKYNVDPQTGTSAPPSYQQATSSFDPNSLEARLVRIRFHLDEETLQDARARAQAQSQASGGSMNDQLDREMYCELPLSFSITSVLGMISKNFGLAPELLLLVWETKDLDLVPQKGKATQGMLEGNENVGSTTPLRYREETLTPRTRSLETWFAEFAGREDTINVRVAFSRMDVERRSRKWIVPMR